MGRFLNADALGGNVGALLSNNTFAYCNNNPVNAKDPNGFRPIYTLGEETDAMREASYRAMNKAAKAISNRISSISTSISKSNYTSTSKSNYSGITNSVVTAAANTFIADEINSILKGFKFSEWKPFSTWTMGTYEMKTGAKITKGAANVVGVMTMATSAVGLVGSLLKGEVYGAAIDLGATALGVGAGYVASGIASLAIAGFSLVGAPAIAVTGAGIVVGLGVSYLINMRADSIKNKHYGR